MANISTNNGRGKPRKGKPRKMNLRVDFTPMVDMNMLLITFFMFCTTLSIPKVMDIVVPTRDGQTPIGESGSLTLIPAGDNKVYYYSGRPDYENYTSLKVTDYGNEGLRNVLLERNSEQFEKARTLKKQLAGNEITKDEFDEKMKEIRRSKEALTVIIKPLEESSYKNLVDVLDEMAVCNISKYAIVDMEEADRFLLENYKTKGALSAQIVN